jgi:regulatory protein YycI of two-component signal transduction system YycFG
MTLTLKDGYSAVDVDRVNTVNPTWRITPKHDDADKRKGRQQEHHGPKQREGKLDTGDRPNNDSHIDDYA